MMSRHLLYLPVVEGLNMELVLIGVEERQAKLVAVRQNNLIVSFTTNHVKIMTLRVFFHVKLKPSNIEAALDPSI